MGLCVSKISIVILRQCLLQWSNGTFTFVLPHYIEYHASNRPTEHDNLPVLIHNIDTDRPFFALSIDMTVTSHWKPSLPILISRVGSDRESLSRSLRRAVLNRIRLYLYSDFIKPKRKRSV